MAKKKKRKKIKKTALKSKKIQLNQKEKNTNIKMNPVIKILLIFGLIIYALINVAGVASMNLLMSTPDNTIKRIIETNLLGSIYCTKAIIPPMIKSKMGRIINFSSIAVE